VKNMANTISFNSSDELKTFCIIAGAVIVAAIIGAWIYSAGREDGINEAKKDNSEGDLKPVIDVPKKNVSEISAAHVLDIEAQTDKEAPKALAVAVPAPVLPKKVLPEPFKHSDDFRTVVCKGKTLALTLYQSLAVKEAKEAALSGFPDVHQEKLLREVGAANKRRLRDTFKSNPLAFKTLFSRGAGKGTFRLNLA
jgi:hypothetical protein